jgi:omega-amidase
MATLRVGLCLDGDPLAPQTLNRLAGADVVLFPELVDSGYAGLKAGAKPRTYGDPLLEKFAALSFQLSCYCIAGSVYLQQPPPPTSNTSLVFHRGRIIYRYDKIHLFRPTGDHLYFSPGKRIGTFRLSLPRLNVRAGIVICYDLRFPEIVRAMALRGLDVLFVPARWPSVRDDIWQALLKARAIENQVFVVGCNALGVEGGPSYIFDPLGSLVFTTHGDEQDRAFLVELELDRIGEAFTLHRNLDEAVVLRSATMPRRVTARRRSRASR